MLTHPGRGADDRDRLDLEPHGPGSRALAQHDVEREVLHGRVQNLLDHVREPMDLVDEQHVAALEAGQDGGQVAGSLDGGAGRRPQLRPDLGRDDRGEGGLAQARWPVQEDVIDRFRSLPSGVDQDPEVLLDPLLAREFVETARAHGGLERGLLGQNFRAADPFDGHGRSLAASQGRRGRPACPRPGGGPPPSPRSPGPGVHEGPLADRCHRSRPRRPQTRPVPPGPGGRTAPRPRQRRWAGLRARPARTAGSSPESWARPRGGRAPRGRPGSPPRPGAGKGSVPRSGSGFSTARTPLGTAVPGGTTAMIEVTPASRRRSTTWSRNGRPRSMALTFGSPKRVPRPAARTTALTSSPSPIGSILDR